MSELPLLLLLLTTLLLSLMAVRWVSDQLDQPSVLSELLLGVAIGNIGVWVGIPFFQVVVHTATESASGAPPAAAHVASVFAALAELGAVLLLFSAGLETSVAKMKRVGGRAAAVAVVGVVAPFGLAYMTCVGLHVEMPTVGHLFLAATLSATSVGITASVLKEMKMMERRESEIILGAAVIDDVLGLVLLAIVSRIAVTGGIELWLIAQTSGVALLLVCLTLWRGESFANRSQAVFEKLDRHNGREFFALALAFGCAWIAESVGLAAIIGAFAAGVILRNHAVPRDDSQRWDQSDTSMTQTIAPLTKFLAPLFFLYVGMQVEIEYFFDLRTLLLALVFSICGIVGKLLSGLPAGNGLDRLNVGVGMVPRGEVGLVFLGVGRGLGAVSDSLFAALVVVVFMTTIVTPPALKWTLRRKKSEIA
jgi:Kef-type K+ transport system membrane component KefB